MYESPVEIIYGGMRTQHENDIYKAVQDVGISVDRDELIRAMRYDRGQYEKGYGEGYVKGYEGGYCDSTRAIADRVLTDFEARVNQAFSKYEERVGDRAYLKPMYRTHAESEIFAIISELKKKYVEGEI